jgi:hypothetical protein
VNQDLYAAVMLEVYGPLDVLERERPARYVKQEAARMARRDSAARAAEASKRAAERRAAALIEDIEFMLDTGETRLGIARRTRMREASLERALARAGRPDLWQRAAS